MVKIYEYIDNSNIYAIFDRTINILIISTNPDAVSGVILLI